MSKTLLHKFSNDREYQLQKNEARKMRTLVEQARGNIERSGARWPFELTQNAHDPGPRPGADEVTIHLSFDGRTVIYQHDGKPFSTQDLAALLSGGSNKEYESNETTGRFGTGFLLTHVLSTRVTFEGVVEANAQYEQVTLHLDRSGDEDAIYKNTVSCATAIEQATTLSHLDSQPTARFIYAADKPDAAELGLAAFSATLPYLYGTCHHLGSVTVTNSNGTLLLKPEKATTFPFEQLHVQERKVATAENNTPARMFKAVRIFGRPDAPSSLLILLEQTNEGWRFLQPSIEFPRLFCRFPLRGSHFLPANVVLDGRFDLSQERDSILMKDADQAQIAEALSLLPPLVRLALQEKWEGAHKIARVGMPEVAFGDALKEPLKGWWREQLRKTAQTLADSPIIMTDADGLQSATGSSSTADFVVPSFDLNQPADELDFASVWQATTELQDPLPAALDIGPDWTAIATEWMSLGISIQRLALTNLADFARDGASKLSELKTKTPPIEWLTRFLTLVGRVSSNHNYLQILTNLLPNQNEALKSPAALHRDAGVHKSLKDISAKINLDVRNRLLLQALADAGEKPGAEAIKNLLEAAIQKTLGNAAVIDECLAELSDQLPDSKPIPEAKSNFREASIELLAYLWASQGSKAAALAQKCPLIASDGSAVRWAAQRKLMAPVSTWHKEAQPFAAIYKDDRILAEEYVVGFGGSQQLSQALTAWDIAFADPLCETSPKELRDEQLKAITPSGIDTQGVIITEQPLSQIALLPNELVQRSQSDLELAKKLLGLAISYAARFDPLWQQTRQVPGHRNKEEVPLSITPALWIADLRTKAWVPAKSDQGTQNVLATAGNLRELLNPAWLANNDPGVRLLTTFFGFNELELRLLATAPSPEVRHQLETGLAKLVEAVGSDPADYSKLTTAYEVYRQRQKEKERNRKFGLAVQAAIQQYLKAHQIHTELIDCGYDYDVYVDLPSLDAGNHEFKLADYMLEVKATTTGEVRLTPAQALTASDDPDHFILCVVDLRGITHEEMEAEWTATAVEPKTRIITGIGSLVNQPHGLVLQATQCQIGLRNDASLRYGVPVPVWSAGIPIADWVQQVKPSLQSATTAEPPTL